MNLGNLSDGENSYKKVFTHSYGSAGRMSMFSSSQKEEASTGGDSFFGSFVDSVGKNSQVDFSAISSFNRRTSIYKNIKKQQNKDAHKNNNFLQVLAVQQPH